MRKVAIISAGPSASLFDNADADSYGDIVGVNGQVVRWPCTWWCFVDWDAFARHMPIGWPQLFIPTRVQTDLTSMGPEHLPRYKGHRITFHETIVPLLLPAELSRWNLFSGIAALGAAVMLHAEEVDVYGADMAGAPGVGEEGGRWAWERQHWDAIVALLERQGVCIRRITA